MKEKNLEEMFEHFLPFQPEIITLTLSRVVSVDSCFTLLGTLQCGATSREALLQNSHTLRFRALTLNSNAQNHTILFPVFRVRSAMQNSVFLLSVYFFWSGLL